jgi:hypothetical protein
MKEGFCHLVVYRDLSSSWKWHGISAWWLYERNTWESFSYQEAEVRLETEVGYEHPKAPSDPLRPTLQNKTTTQRIPHSTTGWGSNVPTREPAGDSSDLTHNNLKPSFLRNEGRSSMHFPGGTQDGDTCPVSFPVMLSSRWSLDCRTSVLTVF